MTYASGEVKYSGEVSVCRIMADLAVGMVQGVAAEMADRPLNDEDEAIAHEALLAPMLKDNDVSRRPNLIRTH